MTEQLPPCTTSPRHDIVQRVVEAFASLKAALGLWLFALLCIVGITIFLYQRAADQQVLAMQARNASDVEALATRVSTELDGLMADIRVLARHPALRAFAREPTAENLLALQEVLYFFAASKRFYHQVRYLDTKGQELVRVDTDNDHPTVVARAQLQNKSSRYYVRDALSSDPGDVYVSELDLNIERGVIEYPRRPMLRLVIKIADDRAATVGLLVLNYQASNLIDLIRDRRIGDQAQSLLVNDGGHFVLAPDSVRDWAYTLPGRVAEDRFSVRFPEASLALGLHQEMSVQTPSGLFAIQTLTYPADATRASQPVRRWILARWTPHEVVDQTLAELRTTTTFLASLAALFALVAILMIKVVRDALRSTGHAEELSRARLHAVLQTAIDGIVTINEQGMIQSFNTAAERIFGWQEREIVGKPVSLLMPERYRNQHDGYVKRYLRTGESHVVGGLRELEAVRSDGSAFPAELSVADSTIDGKRLFTGFIRDITLRREIEEKIKHQALHDDLTGLPNRRKLLTELSVSIESARRRESYGALLVIGLDRFNTVNDGLGHSAGDLFLRETAQRLSNCLSSDDVVARLGADEFAIVLNKLCEREAEATTLAHKLAHSLASAVAQPVKISDTPQALTASIGVMLYPSGNATADTILKHADTALNRAKSSGRNTIRSFRSSMATEVNARLSLASELKQAIDNDELVVHYQPKIDVLAHKVVGLEALIRWQHPKRGLLAPFHFIAFAEEVGLINEIGRWTVDRAIRDMNEVQQNSGASVFDHVAINISPRHFFSTGFVSELKRAFKAAEYPPTRMELEITENLLLDNVELARRKMQSLRELGVSLAIDDFGTGFSSLSYLRSLPVDTIKIDRSFITGLDHVPEKAALVETILSIRKVRPVNFVAEGVETRSECDWLREHGCNVIQGFLYSKPLSLSELLEFRLAADLQHENFSPTSKPTHSHA
ncbi:MAG: EAL domain-containing protein [Gammaproteobacteria bacterium]|nr:EAL domain-containing protein [Gammaproteobacteria bacterium]